MTSGRTADNPSKEGKRAMSKSALLRVRDVRDAYRLIGECRDLGHDPALWHPRMLEGLLGLVGVAAAAGGEGRWLRPHQTPRPVSAFDAGLDAEARALFTAYMRDLGPGGDPIFRALQRRPGRLVTLHRRELVGDSEWYRSVAWNEYRRPIHLQDQLTSVLQVSDSGAVSVIALHRRRGERDFSPRQKALLGFFHAELGRLIGRSLVSATELGADTLSPRLRQTLACLLEGDSEKQVAARLGVSRTTTHQYITALYRHFAVHSRAELMAHLMKRLSRGSDAKPDHA